MSKSQNIYKNVALSPKQTQRLHELGFDTSKYSMVQVKFPDGHIELHHRNITKWLKFGEYQAIMPVMTLSDVMISWPPHFVPEVSYAEYIKEWYATIEHPWNPHIGAVTEFSKSSPECAIFLLTERCLTRYRKFYFPKLRPLNPKEFKNPKI